MQIYIVPTYNCNLSCKKCYSKRYSEEFPDYLSWNKFISIFKLFNSNYNRFSFIGGEPTKWKFINEAILFLHNKNKYVSIFTNGTVLLGVIPNNLILNGNIFFNAELRKKIIRNLSIYKKNRIRIRLRFNVDENFKKKNIYEAVMLSKQFADSVSISILYPIENEINYGKKIFDLANKLYSESIPVVISRATPFCLFNQKQRDFLISNCKLKGKCSVPTNSFVINPDGQTIQPCVELYMNHNISELSENRPKDIFTNDLIKIKANRSMRCNSCIYYSNDECWGGCLSYPPPNSNINHNL